MKVRLDQYLVDQQLAFDIVAARAMIGAGEVFVNETLSDKAGHKIEQSAEVRIKSRGKFVSRGGIKLAGALSSFDLDVTGQICLDIGASTGGFTDCLLQNGAAKVYAIDVAYGQLAWKIRQDPRVVVLERFNARKLDRDVIQGDTIGFAVLDVSFISLTKVLPAVFNLFTDHTCVVALIKPQFELPRDDIGPGGVVSVPALHQKAIDKIENFVVQSGLVTAGVATSPILGPKGNTEFLIHISSPG